MGLHWAPCICAVVVGWWFSLWGALGRRTAGVSLTWLLALSSDSCSPTCPLQALIGGLVTVLVVSGVLLP